MLTILEWGKMTHDKLSTTTNGISQGATAIKNYELHQEIEKMIPSALHQNDVLPNMKKRKRKKMITTESIDWNAPL